MPLNVISPATVVILLLTVIFRPVRLIQPAPVAETGWLTVMLFELVARLRLAPFEKLVLLDTLIVPDVALVKFTDRLFTKLAVEVPNWNEEFPTVPPLSFTRIDVKPEG